MMEFIKRNRKILIVLSVGVLLAVSHLSLTGTSNRNDLSASNAPTSIEVKPVVERISRGEIDQKIENYRKLLKVKCEAIERNKEKYKGSIEDKIALCNGMYDKYRGDICHNHAKVLPIVDAVQYEGSLSGDYRSELTAFVDKIQMIDKEARIIEDNIKAGKIPSRVGLLDSGLIYTSVLMNDPLKVRKPGMSDRDFSKYSPYFKTYSYTKGKAVESPKDLKSLNRGWIRAYYEVAYTFDCIK